LPEELEQHKECGSFVDFEYDAAMKLLWSQNEKEFAWFFSETNQEIKDINEHVEQHLEKYLNIESLQHEFLTKIKEENLLSITYEGSIAEVLEQLI